jgi:pectin methylesterase-like acyl-CoA thioesterase
MHITRRFALAGLTMLLIVVLSGPAFSATVEVGTCSTFVNFATIQQAIDASPAGSIVKICPGTYKEQPEITKAITLQGIV